MFQVGQNNVVLKEVIDVQEILLALFTGFIVGLLFAAIRLPIPAPPALAGVVGIVGIYLGYKVYQWLALFFTR